MSGFAIACVIVLWLFTRESPMAEQVTSPLAAAQVPGALEAPQARARPEPLPASQPVATPAPEPQPELIVTPLFDTNTRFELRKATTLRLRAQHGAPAGPATGANLAVSVLHLPDRKEARLAVREVGEGVYEAEFVPQQPGQFVLAVASAGKAARTAVPVSLGVVGTVGETAAGPANDRSRASASASRSRRGELGGTVTRRGR